MKLRSKYKNMIARVGDIEIQFRNGVSEEILDLRIGQVLLDRGYELLKESDINNTQIFDFQVVSRYTEAINRPTFTISILCHNHKDHTQRCIEHVLKSKYQNFEIIISDNGSEDDSIKYLKTITDKRIHVIENKKNLGFIQGHINALNYAKGKYFLILNNDMFCEDIWLDRILEGFSDLNTKIVGPISCTLDNNGNGCPTDSFSLIDYIEGSCLAIPTIFAKKIGLFDTKLLKFAYFEDSDLNLRVRSMGYRIKKVTFNYTHYHAITTNSLTKIDIKKIHRENNKAFVQRWSHYLKTRGFEKTYIIKRTGAIGDTFLVSPIIEYLKEKNRKSKILLVTQCSQLFINNPNVKITQYHSDIEFNLDDEYEKFPKKHILEAYADKMGIDWKKLSLPKIYLNEDDKKYINLQKQLQDKYVVVHVEPTKWPGRNLSSEIIKKVIEKLRKITDYKFIEIGKTKILDNVDLSLTNLPMNLTVSVIRGASGFIGIDSALMHIVQTYEVPGTVAFGCINPKYRLINSNILIPTISKSDCKFCHHDLPAPRYFSDCRLHNPRCMREIRAIDLIENFKKGVRAKMAISETEKIRDKVLKYCIGNGIDIGSRHDKIVPEALGIDIIDEKDVDKVLDASQPLPFKNNEFDYIFSSHCLEHIEDIETTLKEWLRILKSGGYIMLYLPHKDLYTVYNPEHFHNFVNEDITKILKTFDCDIVEDLVHNHKSDEYSFLVVGKKK